MKFWASRGMIIVFLLLAAVIPLFAGAAALPPTEDVPGIRYANGNPFLTLDKWGGIVGSVIHIRAKGFTPERAITFTYASSAGMQFLGSAWADALGSCELDVTIPASQQGVNRIVANNDSGQSVAVKFTVIPNVMLAPQRVTSGDMVNITGTGFTEGSVITVFLDQKPVGYGEVNIDGRCVVTFTVPALLAGINVVEIREKSGESHWREITVYAKISLNKTEGEIGSRVTITGSGFGQNSAVSLKFDSYDIGIVASDFLGKFSFTFTVPVSNAGVHFITASDHTNIEQAPFNIEAVPPPVPEVVTPKRKQSIPQPVFLDWGSVYDPSEPVSYQIQISHDADFLKTVTSRDGITQSQYTLTEEARLLPNPRLVYYFWRVRAIDSAGNIGGWSEPIAFQVTPGNQLPQWAKTGLIVFQVLIVIFFGILLTRILIRSRNLSGH